MYVATPGLATWGVVDPQLGQREVLEFFCQLQGACRRLPGALLGLWRCRKTQEQVTAELMMIGFVSLDSLTVQSGGLVIALGLAQLNKLLVLHHSDRFARELSCSYTLNGVFESREIIEEGTETLRQWIEVCYIHAQLLQVCGNQTVVFRFVPGLTRQGEFDVYIIGRDQPARR